MSSIRTQSQLSTVNPIPPLVQCQVSFRLLPPTVAAFVLNEIFLG